MLQNPTILLVDDDAFLIGLLSHIFIRARYGIVTFRSGRDAIRHSQRHEIDLLITDVVMRQLSGYDVAERVTAIQPKAAVLLMSGYPDGALVLRPKWRFLAKPFTPASLLEIVGELIGVPA